MSVSSTLRRAGPYSTNGVQTAFPFAFKVFNASDVVATTSVGGTDTTLAYGTDYSVSLNADQDATPGGTVTISPALNGPTVTLTSEAEYEQPVVFSNQGGFYPRVLNDSLDRLTIFVQQLAEKVGRAALRSLGTPVPGRYLVTDAEGNFTYSDGTGSDGALRSDLAASAGSALVAHTLGTTTALTKSFATLYNYSQTVSVFNWLTPTQIDDVVSYTGALDLTSVLQAAMNESWAANKNLFIPAGLYSVTGLIIPGGKDSRNRGWKMLGQGHGEAFARAFTAGTIIASNTPGTPVIRVEPDLVPAGVGTYEIAGFRFEQTNAAATAPVAWFKSMYGPCNIHDNTFYQAGKGHGVLIDFAATTSFHDNYIMSFAWPGDPATPPTVNSIGLHVRNTHDAGLMSISKVTARGWDIGYQVGDTDVAYDGQVISCTLRDCESSYCKTGAKLVPVSRGTVIDNFYFEGGLQGVGVENLGNSTSVTNSYFFAGSSKGIWHRSGARGAIYTGNTISLGNSETAAPNPIGYDIEGGVATVLIHGGFVVHDPDSYGPVANAKAFRVSGEDPRVDIIGVDINPASGWSTAAGAMVCDTTAVTGGGVIGQIPGENNSNIAPVFRGSVSFANGATHGAADMSGGTLTVRDGSNFALYNDGATVNKINQGSKDHGRILVIKLLGTVQIQNSAYILLIGGKTFSGSGNSIVLISEISGSDTIWTELSRHTPNGVAGAEKAASVAAPAGGATVDAEARAQLAATLTALKNAGIMVP